MRANHVATMQPVFTNNLSPESVVAWANLEILSLKVRKILPLKSRIVESLIRISKAVEKDPALIKDIQNYKK